MISGMAKPESDLISVADAAKILKVTPVRVRQYIADGRLKAEQIGRAFVLRRSVVMSFERREPGRPAKDR
jgi:excisionase family DNA binding protein